MRTLLFILLAAGSLTAQVDVDQIYLDLGIREGEAFYDIETYSHVPGQEPTLQTGVMVMSFSDLQPDGSAWLSVSYASLSRDGVEAEAAELETMNAALAAMRMHISKRWEVLAVEGEMLEGVADARARYHEALDRLMAGEAEALPQVAVRGLHLSALLAAERAGQFSAGLSLGGSGLQMVIDALEKDPAAAVAFEDFRTVGPLEVASHAHLSGKQLVGVRSFFSVDSGFSAALSGVGVEASRVGTYNRWGLVKEEVSRFEYFAGPFGGSSRVTLSLAGFAQPAEDVEPLACAACGQAVSGSSRVLYDAAGQPQSFCSADCEMDYILLGLNEAKHACAGCGVIGTHERILTDADGNEHAFCGAGCERRFLFSRE